MYLNSKEEKVIKELFCEINNVKDLSKKFYNMKWEDGTDVDVYDYSVYESDNDLDINDVNYEEYWACAMIILEIHQKGDTIKGLKEGDVFEISYKNFPIKYKRINRNWEKEKKKYNLE